MGMVSFLRRESVKGVASRFTHSNSGNVAVIFGLTLLPIVLTVGASLDYARIGLAKQRLQAAATQTTVSQTQRQALANNVVQSNLGTLANAINASVTETDGTGNYSVSASANIPTTVMRIARIPSRTIYATATAVPASVTPVTYYAGNGSVAGDPHIAGADGASGYLSCTSPSGSWYNLLSDSGVEVNVSCASYPGDKLDVLQSFSILVGTHVISLYAPQPTFDSAGNASYDPSTAWFGAITIDGVTYPPVIGAHSYLGGLIKTNITDLTNFYASDNMIHINTGVYNIFITYDEYAMGDINITATNAGGCGVPGGFWGGTLAGRDDYNGIDFLVSGPTAKAPEFYWGKCEPTTTSVHLVK